LDPSRFIRIDCPEGHCAPICLGCKNKSVRYVLPCILHGTGLNPDQIPNISDYSSRLGYGEFSTRDQARPPQFIEIRPLSFKRKADRVGNLSKFEDLINRRQAESEARTDALMDPAPELELLLTETEPERPSNYPTAPAQPIRVFGPPADVPLENKFLTSIGGVVRPQGVRSRRQFTGDEPILMEMMAALEMYGLAEAEDGVDPRTVIPSAGLEREARKESKRSSSSNAGGSPAKSSKKTSKGGFSFGLEPD